MKALKAFAILFAFFFAISFAATNDAQAQTFLPSANKIVYTTNSVEVQDSIKKVSYSLKKGTIIVQNNGTGTGATATLIEAHSLRRIWAGPVAGIRIVGVVNSDSLKILSLKTTPY